MHSKSLVVAETNYNIPHFISVVPPLLLAHKSSLGWPAGAVFKKWFTAPIADISGTRILSVVQSGFFNNISFQYQAMIKMQTYSFDLYSFISIQFVKVTKYQNNFFFS